MILKESNFGNNTFFHDSFGQRCGRCLYFVGHEYLFSGSEATDYEGYGEESSGAELGSTLGTDDESDESDGGELNDGDGQDATTS